MGNRYTKTARAKNIKNIKMAKKNSELINQIISNLNWDAILQSNKVFKLGIGDSSIVIPGIKKKPYNEITKNDLKNELKTLIDFIIENNAKEVAYGPWILYWNNIDWQETLNNLSDEELEQIQENDPEFDLENEILSITQNTTLEVMYCPHRIQIFGQIDINKDDDSDLYRLENMLKKAINEDNYEVANKIKELMELQSN